VVVTSLLTTVETLWEAVKRRRKERRARKLTLCPFFVGGVYGAVI